MSLSLGMRLGSTFGWIVGAETTKQAQGYTSMAAEALSPYIGSAKPYLETTAVAIGRHGALAVGTDAVAAAAGLTFTAYSTYKAVDAHYRADCKDESYWTKAAVLTGLATGAHLYDLYISYVHGMKSECAALFDNGYTRGQSTAWSNMGCDAIGSFTRFTDTETYSHLANITWKI